MLRVAAGAVALICWAGLAIRFNATYGQYDVGETLWILARYFTIITNLLLAIAMTMVAAGKRLSPFILGGLTLAILLVGVVYALLLSGLMHLSGGAVWADILLHKVSPPAMALWWLLYAPRSQLRWSAPVWWAVYPVAYFAYAILRAMHGDKYPYPFMDVGKLGWQQTLLNVGGIAMAFLIAGALLVWIDGWRPLGSRRSSR